ncbi:MAG: AAA family ATPase [Chloroflexi bacterium]|nr:AAA family ATPase [Chloroflexota bacterium]
MLKRLETKQNIILQGPPGAGKTWLSKRLAYALIGLRDDSQIRQMQFHPNLSYEDFVRGYRPQSDGKLDLADGPFLQLCDTARRDQAGKYVMVIEEINRGNPASIFGELLTLLEADKRDEHNALRLAYTKDDEQPFHIPPNVYVIGTMNLADRSLALVDIALRRRFAFFDLEPAFNETWLDWVREPFSETPGFASTIKQRIDALNSEIARDSNLGDQFRVGHSHFTPASDAIISDPIEWYKDVVETEIAPLLREYWFDNRGRADEEIEKLTAGL